MYEPSIDSEEEKEPKVYHVNVDKIQSDDDSDRKYDLEYYDKSRTGETPHDDSNNKLNDSEVRTDDDQFEK